MTINIKHVLGTYKKAEDRGEVDAVVEAALVSDAQAVHSGFIKSYIDGNESLIKAFLFVYQVASELMEVSEERRNLFIISLPGPKGGSKQRFTYRLAKPLMTRDGLVGRKRANANKRASKYAIQLENALESGLSVEDLGAAIESGRFRVTPGVISSLPMRTAVGQTAQNVADEVRSESAAEITLVLTTRVGRSRQTIERASFAGELPIGPLRRAFWRSIVNTAEQKLKRVRKVQHQHGGADANWGGKNCA